MSESTEHLVQELDGLGDPRGLAQRDVAILLQPVGTGDHTYGEYLRIKRWYCRASYCPEGPLDVLYAEAFDEAATQAEAEGREP